jgi:hypothetical protein
MGIGQPLAQATMTTVVIDAVRSTEIAVTAGLLHVMRLIGGVIGGEAIASVLSDDTLPHTRAPAESAFVVGFGVSAAAAFVALVLAVVALSGHRSDEAKT